MNKLILGFGFNDGTKQSACNGKIFKEYNLWRDMLRRCFGKREKEKYPTYKDCSASANFLNYSFFHDWCQHNIGFGLEGWNLDKDIIIKGNKLYSEDTCCFVPREINVFFTDRTFDRGEYPVGVCFHKNTGKLAASCSVNGKRKHLGLFDNPEEAFNTYKLFKEDECKKLANKWRGKIDERVYNAMINWVV